MRCLPTGSWDTHNTLKLSSTSCPPNLRPSLAQLPLKRPHLSPRHWAARKHLWCLPLGQHPAQPGFASIPFFRCPLSLACFLLVTCPSDPPTVIICGLSSLRFILYVAARFLQHNSISVRCFHTTVRPRAASLPLCDSVFSPAIFR